MPWRMVKCPNGRYARFSTVVDNFTHYNMNREEAVELAEFEGCGLYSEQKVLNADLDEFRYVSEMNTIEIVHGKIERDKAEKMILEGVE